MAKSWRRSCGCDSGASANVLTVLAEDMGGETMFVSWTWTGPDPDHWALYNSYNGGAFNYVGDLAGNQRDTTDDVTPHAGDLYQARLVGRDLGNVDITPIVDSNTVPIT